MFLIVKIVTIVMMVVQGQITFSEPPRAPEPVIVDEVAQTITEEQVWVQSEIYPDIQVVERVDGQGVPALVPLTSAEVSPEDSWALFWAMNPDLLESVNNNYK
jgi:hypothetical protein